MNFVLEDATGNSVHTETSDAVFTRPKEVPLVRYKGTIYAPYQFLYTPKGDAFIRVHCREAAVIDICAAAAAEPPAMPPSPIWPPAGYIPSTSGWIVLPTTTTVTFLTNGDPTVYQVSVANTLQGDELVSDPITGPAACFLAHPEGHVPDVTLGDDTGRVLARKEIPPTWHVTRHDSLTMCWPVAAYTPTGAVA